MKTGRKDSKESYVAEVDEFIPNHNDTMSLVLLRFQSIGIDVEGTVALLGKYFPQFLSIQYLKTIFGSRICRRKNIRFEHLTKKCKE